MRILKHYKWLLALGVASVLSGAIIVVHSNTVKTEQKLNNQIHQLEAKTKAQQNAAVEKLNLQIKERDKIIQQKDKELQSKAESKERARIAAVEAPKTPLTQKVVQSIVPTAQAATGDAKSYIYFHESGNRPGAINASSGACGLGQALPCSKMPCSLSDYACQDTFFTNYMLSRYGSWEAARAFHLAHNWW